jgi:hypothetical protein
VEEAVHPDRWVPLAEGERKAAVPVRSEGKWAAGLFPFLGRGVPEAFFYIFFVLPSFLFLFSYFFCSFCIMHPNKVKPLSKFL